MFKKSLSVCGSLILTFVFVSQTFAGNSLPRFVDSAAQVDPQSGTANMGIAIEVPPGRGGIQPSVQLQYSSGGPNGIAGVGWMLELGSVQVSTKNGLPKYDSTDEYVLMQSGSTQELVYDSTAGFYRAKIEGSFMRTKKLTNGSGVYWEVTDKSGTKYIFGQNASAREADPSTPSKIFKWFLERVEDVNGNYMTIDYINPGSEGRVLPNSIKYTGSMYGSGILPYAEVKFSYYPTDRADVSTNYISGFKRTLKKRLEKIEVFAASALQRKYTFNYDYAMKSKRSLLKAVNQLGADGTALPTKTFSYEENPTGDYQIIPNSATGVPNVWNMKYDNNFTPSGDMAGCSPVNMCNGVNWGQTYTNYSNNFSNVTYGIDSSTGRLFYTINDQHTAVYFWTYMYNSTSSDKVFTIQGNDEDETFNLFVNGVFQGTPLSHPYYLTIRLKPGWNLVEFTDYLGASEGFPQSSIYCPSEGNLCNFAAQVTMASVIPFVPTMTGDFNADGLTDLAAYSKPDKKLEVSLSTGAGFAPATSTSNFWAGATVFDEVYQGNFNNDGYTDLIGYNRVAGYWNVWPSNSGSSFSEGGQASNFGPNAAVGTADFNGDGLTDLYFIDAPSGNYRLTMSMNVNGVISDSSPEFTADIGTNDGSSPMVVDINGDNLADVVTYKQSTGEWKLLVNTGVLGNAFVQTDTKSFGSGYKPVITDFNNDGLVDFGYYKTTDKKIYYHLSDGNLISSTEGELAAPFAFNDSNPNVYSADFNGDGVTDFMLTHFTPSSSANEIAFSNTDGKFGDVMISSSNGIGGTTTIDYASSALYDNDFMPFTTPVVESVTVSNGLGDSYTTRYSYSKGLWVPAERDFRGFGTVKVIDPDGNYSETDYDQSDDKKGHPIEQRTYDKDNKLFSKTAMSYEAYDLGNGSTFVYLKRKVNHVYDGDTTLTNAKATAEEYTYDTQYGNLKEVKQYGEVLNTSTASSISDTDSDTRIVQTDYLNNPTTWIIGLPWQTRTYSNTTSDLMRRTDFIYDGNLYYSSSQTLTKGQLKKKREYAGSASGTVHPETTYTYDNYGNLETTTSPLGVSTSMVGDYMTTITYDSTYQLFPITTTNALTHAVKNYYFGLNASGVPAGCTGLWGQLYETEDPNQQKGKRCYDTFGRTVKTISPLDSYSYPTTITEYTAASTYFKVTSKQRVTNGQSGTIDSYQFIDGLGRAIQTKSPTDYSNKFSVSGITKYNSRGLAIEQYQPFFSTTGGSITVDTLYTPTTVSSGTEKITVEYDAMGRVKKTINPGGTFSTVEYKKWTTETIDENGHKQGSDFDAYGRLVYKYDYTGVTPNFSVYGKVRYYYDSEGNLTKTEQQDSSSVVKATTTITYNKLGQKTAMTDSDMGTWSYEYDLNGNLYQQIDAKGQAITFGYDQLNRLLTKTFTDGSTPVTYTYDNDATQSYEKGRLVNVNYHTTGDEATSFEYDQIGREIESIKKINNSDNIVTRSYNALNNLLNVTYPDSNKAFYRYDPAGRIIKIGNDQSITGGFSNINYTTFAPPSDPDSEITETSSCINYANVGTYNTNAYNYKSYTSGADFTYQLDFQLSSSTVAFNKPVTVWGISDTTGVMTTWANGAAVTINRDGASNVLLRIRKVTGGAYGANQLLPTNLVLNTRYYLTIIGAGSGLTVKVYSDANRTTLVDQVTYTNAFTTSMNYLYGFSVTNDGSSEYPATGDVCNLKYAPYSTITTAIVYVQSVIYLANGQIDYLILGNGVAVNYEYDNRQRLTRINSYKGSTKFQDLNYTYDSAGNILTINDTTSTNHDQTFTYDELNRLKSAAGYYDNNGATYATRTYTYDTMGNITTKDGWSYLYNESGTYAGKHAVSSRTKGGDTWHYTYDLNGNMLTKQLNSGTVTHYEYDIENRLKSVKNGTTLVAEYFYDGDGGRTKKKVYNGGTSTTTVFVGSLSEKTNNKDTNYIFLGDTRIASITDGVPMYYLHDHLGGTNKLLDASAVVKEKTEYDPFGATSLYDQTGTPEQVAHYYFSNHYKDAESGLIFMQARYYDPELGRFITADTINQAPNNTQTFNRYTYCNNNPVNLVDPTGHRWSWRRFAAAFVQGFISAVAPGPAGGAVAGALGSAINGENIGQGARFGAIGSTYLGKLYLTRSYADNTRGYTDLLLGMFPNGNLYKTIRDDSWDSYAGGTVGSYAGSALGSFLIPDSAGTATDTSNSSGYQHLSSRELPDLMTDLMREYNSVRTSPFEKAAFAEMFAKAADSAALISTWDEAFVGAVLEMSAAAVVRGAAAVGKGLIGAVNNFNVRLGNAGFARFFGGAANQMRRLSAGEIKLLKNSGLDIHQMKPDARFDLFKNTKGDIYYKPKNGRGPGESTGHNINDF